jgi:hypothetical protein
MHRGHEGGDVPGAAGVGARGVANAHLKHVEAGPQHRLLVRLRLGVRGTVRGEHGEEQQAEGERSGEGGHGSLVRNEFHQEWPPVDEAVNGRIQ